jgi:hypothetical protein
MVGNRELIAERSFLQAESSPAVLQRLARGPQTAISKVNGDLLDEDFRGAWLHFNETMSSPRPPHPRAASF